MDKKEFFENLKKEANTTLSKIFDKVEEVSKVSALKMKISTLKTKIRDCKTEIGEYVYQNPNQFEDIPQIKELLENIEEYAKEIAAKQVEIEEHHEKEGDKETE